MIGGVNLIEVENVHGQYYMFSAGPGPDGGGPVRLADGVAASAATKEADMPRREPDQTPHRPRPRNIFGFKGYDG